MRKPDLTIEQVLAIAKRDGMLTCNPLQYRRARHVNACFAAAKQGLLRKVRVNCGMFHFYPLEKP